MHCLRSLIKSDKNFSIIEKEIKKIEDENIANDTISTIYFLLKKGESLPNILKEIRAGRIYWDNSSFDDVKKEREEKDDFIINPFQVVEGVSQCRKCGGKRTVSYSKQTRSADEPMTTFAICVNKECGEKWSYSG